MYVYDICLYICIELKILANSSFFFPVVEHNV